MTETFEWIGSKFGKEEVTIGGEDFTDTDWLARQIYDETGGDGLTRMAARVAINVVLKALFKLQPQVKEQLKAEQERYYSEQRGYMEEVNIPDIARLLLKYAKDNPPEQVVQSFADKDNAAKLLEESITYLADILQAIGDDYLHKADAVGELRKEVLRKKAS